jgi:hypothetical protein
MLSVAGYGALASFGGTFAAVAALITFVASALLLARDPEVA